MSGGLKICSLTKRPQWATVPTCVGLPIHQEVMKVDSFYCDDVTVTEYELMLCICTCLVMHKYMRAALALLILAHSVLYTVIYIHIDYKNRMHYCWRWLILSVGIYVCLQNLLPHMDGKRLGLFRRNFAGRTSSVLEKIGPITSRWLATGQNLQNR